MRRFHDSNPAAVALYYLCVTGVTMFSVNPVIISISLPASVLNYCLYAEGGVKPHVFSAVLLIVLTAVNPLVNHNGMTVLFYLNDRPITAEACIYGLVTAGTVVASLYWIRLFTKAMTSDRLLYLFGRLSPKLSLILSMSIRYVELLRGRWRRIRDTQRALGLYDDGNPIDALKGSARVLSILITWAIENGIITAESMEARGYGTGRRMSFRMFRFRSSDAILVIVFIALTALGVIGIGAAKIVYYPAIGMDLTEPVSIAGYGGFAVLSILPVIINTKEAVRWRYLRSAV